VLITWKIKEIEEIVSDQKVLRISGSSRKSKVVWFLTRDKGDRG